MTGTAALAWSDSARAGLRGQSSESVAAAASTRILLVRESWVGSIWIAGSSSQTEFVGEFPWDAIRDAEWKWSYF